ncbi:MAG: hypothetical protein JWO02_2623, partial [Solirubrobacterales bacterium]|nr:hypothetical protein [Solirubrobacterales bacterium]
RTPYSALVVKIIDVNPTNGVGDDPAPLVTRHDRGAGARYNSGPRNATVPSASAAPSAVVRFR